MIEARNLGYEYPDGTRGVNGIDVTIDAGERIAILGPNGSGKSTLQLLLGGLHDPATGYVEYFGGERDPERVRDRLGVLLQDPDDYLFNSTVREDIEYGPAQLDMPREVATGRMEWLCDELDLHDVLDNPPFRLSGGEKKRAALASVLAFDPDVLLLDEPISSLDGRYRERVLDLLDGLARDGRTVITFTPAVELVSDVADRVLLIAPDGTLAANGSPREILTDSDLLADTGLRPPAIVRLFDGFVEPPPLTVETARELLRTTGLTPE